MSWRSSWRLAYVVWSIAAVVRARGRRKRRAYSAVLGAVCAGLTICAATCLLWGVCYYTDTFQDRSGIRAEEVSLADLTGGDRLVRRQVWRRRRTRCPGMRTGCFDVSLDEILADSAAHLRGGWRSCFPSWSLRTGCPSGCPSPGS